ncbi:MAG: hypothetical protein WDO74_10475 [Pseudomonadota bacterium]
MTRRLRRLRPRVVRCPTIAPTASLRCVPPPGWVQRLCEDVYPDVALNMFKPGTRWKRLYMLARAEPFNASGGASLLGDKLERGEEVIALKRRDNDGAMQVGDNAGYDVLRWNGACATIHDGDSRAPRPARDRSLEDRMAAPRFGFAQGPGRAAADLQSPGSAAKSLPRLQHRRSHQGLRSV